MNTETTLQNALRAHQQGHWDEAAQLYQQLLALSPDNVEVLQSYAVLCAQRGAFSEAKSLFQQALVHDIANPSLYYNLANVERRLGEVALACEHYHIALKLKPDYAKAHNALANCYAKQAGQGQLALKHYAQAVQSQPDYLDAHLNLAQLFYQQSQLQEAIVQLNNVLQLNEQHSQARLLLANILLQQGQAESAIPHYQAVLAEQPDNVDALNNYAAALVALARYVEGLKQFALALKVMPEKIDTRMNMAATFLQLDRFDEAIYHYQLCVQSGCRDAEIYYNLGVAFMSQGKLQQGIQQYQQCLDHKPNHVAAITNLGACYLKQELVDKALTYYQQAHDLSPDNQEINYMLSALTQEKIPNRAPISYVTQLFDNYANHYEKHMEDVLQCQVPKQLAQRIKQTIQKPIASLVDVGCGSGLSGLAVQALTKQLIGIDLSAKMLAKAAEKNIYHQLLCGDLLTHLQSLHDIDVIMAADVLVYLGDLREFLHLCAKAKGVDGIIAFTTEQGAGNGFQLNQHGRFIHGEAYLTNQAHEAGLKVICHENMNLRLQNNQPVIGRLTLLC